MVGVCRMMSEKTVQELQVKKRELQSKLSALLSSKQCSKDDINEIKSEILHIDKLIEKKVGNKELKRQEEINRRKSGKDQAIFKKQVQKNFRNVCCSKPICKYSRLKKL